MHERIQIKDIAKIEGHASFVADIVRGDVRNARVKVEEGARFFEGMLIGRKIDEMPVVASRICGVCPTVHNLTAHKAMERALGIQPSEQTIFLRKLMLLGQILSSHGLHLYFFSCSDFLGLESDLELVKKCPVEADWSIKIRDIGNHIQEIIGGRTVHPLTPRIGGFRKLPKLEGIKAIKDACSDFLPKAVKLAEFFVALDYPKFERPTDYFGLENEDEYAIYDGSINNLSEEEFYGKIKEIQEPGKRVKHTHYNNAYMIGALARINFNHAKLNSEARRLVQKLGIKFPVANPFYNIFAQAVEMAHCLEEAVKISDKILSDGLRDEPLSDNFGNGRGIAATEAPRGLLFYDVEIKDGIIKNLNIITPTVQNLANLEADLEDFEKFPGWSKMNAKQRKQKIAMLIRAYDPCITCAVH